MRVTWGAWPLARPSRYFFYFVLDEFALLPRLSHIADGINFGRELGLRFLVATQNVNQVLVVRGPGQRIVDVTQGRVDQLGLGPCQRQSRHGPFRIVVFMRFFL